MTEEPKTLKDLHNWSVFKAGETTHTLNPDSTIIGWHDNFEEGEELIRKKDLKQLIVYWIKNIRETEIRENKKFEKIWSEEMKKVLREGNLELEKSTYRMLSLFKYIFNITEDDLQ